MENCFLCSTAFALKQKITAVKGDRDSVHRGRFPAIKDICTVLCVWRAWSIGKDRCYLPHDLSITTWKKRLRAFQAKTRLSNSFLPAGCHTAQQLLLKLSELIILQSPPSCTYAAPDSIFKLPLHCAIQVCARDCLTFYQYCICIYYFLYSCMYFFWGSYGPLPLLLCHIVVPEKQEWHGAHSSE